MRYEIAQFAFSFLLLTYNLQPTTYNLQLKT